MTLQPSGPVGHCRVTAEPRLCAAPGLTPPVPRGEGAAPAADPGQQPLAPCRGDGTGQGWWPGPFGQRCPSPAPPSPPGAEAGGERLPTAARPALTPVAAPASSGVRPSRGSRGAAASRHGPGDSLFPARRLQGSLPFPRRGTRDAPSQELSAVSFLAGSVGKTGGSRGSAPGQRSAPLPSVTSPGWAGDLSGWHSTGQEPLPACGQHLRGHEGPRKVPLAGRASPALDILLFGS